MAKINLLHLRHAAGWGGGPDTVLPFKMRLLDRERFCGSVAYLVNSGENIDQIARSMHEAGVALTEVPGGRFIDPVQLYRLHRLIRSNRIDILHCHEPKSDLYGLLLKLFNPRLKLVSTLHGWIVRSRKSWFYNTIDIWCLRYFKLRIAVSTATRDLAERHRLKDVVLLRNGVDADYWKTARKERLRTDGNVKIGFAGRLSPEKGPADFIRTARLIVDEYPDCNFLLAGEGSELVAVQQLVTELGLEGQVQFLGLLTKAEMKGFYQQLDLLLLPSRTEGLPNVILQALSMALPVVANRVGGVEELVRDEHTGLLVESGDVVGMACQTLRLLRDPQLAQSLGRNGRTLMETDFSMERRVRKLEELYLKMVGGS